MAKKKRAKKNPKRAAKKRKAPKRSNPHRAKKRSAPKRSNPHRAKKKRKNPARRRGHARKRNPGGPELLMNVGKALIGGAAAAGIVAGTMAVGRKFPMTKGKAIALQAAGAIVGGGVLAALGAPTAGAVVAASLTGTAIATAQTPSVPTAATDTTKQVSGVLPHVAGLLGESVDRNRMVSGIIKNMRAGR